MKKRYRGKLSLKEIWKCFSPSDFAEKYHHLGYSHTTVPKHWVPYVEQCLIKLEKLMWPQWYLPMWTKRLIHYLATDNSVVRVMFNWAMDIRRKFAYGQINQIKDKFGSLRIYISGTEEMHKIIEECEIQCANICEKCGKNNNVQLINKGWVYCLCQTCREKE